jgi:hypothetical protein
MINIPTENPETTDMVENVFSSSCLIQFIIETTTWNMAPAPIERNTTAANEE